MRTDCDFGHIALYLALMYSKEEKKQLNIDFFEAFAAHMKPHKSVGGGGSRWESYKTGVKGLYFRMELEPEIILTIDIQTKDPGVRLLMFEQFWEFIKILEGHWEEKPIRSPVYVMPTGQEISRVWVRLDGHKLTKREHWPAIITWFEKKWVGLDEFWELVQDVVKDLSK